MSHAIAIGTQVVGFNATSQTLTPTYPTTVAGGALFCVVPHKPNVTNDGTAPTITGWTIVAERSGANDGDTGGYGDTAPAADVGNVNIFVLRRNTDADGTESGTISVGFSTGGVGAAQIFCASATGGIDSVLYGTSKDITGGNTNSVILGNPTTVGLGSGDVDAGDRVLCFFAATSDAPTYGSASFSHTGVTFGAATSAAWSTNLGSDAGGFHAYADATAGPASANDLTLTYTVSGSGNNARGPAAFIRVREATGGGTITGDLTEVAEQVTESLAGGVVITAALTESASPATESVTGSALLGGQLSESVSQADEDIEGAALLGATLAEIAAQATEELAGALLIGGTLAEQAEPATETITNEQNLTGQLDETTEIPTEDISGGPVLTASLAEVAAPASESLAGTALLGGTLTEQHTQATEALSGVILLSGALDESTGVPIETISSDDGIAVAPPVAAGPWVDTITTAPVAAGPWVDTQSPPVAAGAWADTV